MAIATISGFNEFPAGSGTRICHSLGTRQKFAAARASLHPLIGTLASDLNDFVPFICFGTVRAIPLAGYGSINRYRGQRPSRPDGIA